MEPILHRLATTHGFTPGELRSGLFAHPVDGVAMPAASTDDLEAVCRAVQLVLPPTAVFTHWTSALLRRWWLPTVPSPGTIACTWGSATHLERRGVYLRRCEIPLAHRVELNGLRVASAAWTIVELAEHLRLVDLVAAIDSALHFGHTTIEEISSTMRQGRRGVRVLRRAIRLADGRSESPWETYLRLLHVLCDIAVEPQREIHDQFRRLVGRGDLAIVGTRRIAEYDGANHRDRDRHRHDLRREKALARLGFERYGYTASEILDNPARILRDAEDARGLPHLPARLLPWTEATKESSLSRFGGAGLIARLQRFVRTESPRSTGAH